MRGHDAMDAPAPDEPGTPTSRWRRALAAVVDSFAVYGMAMSGYPVPGYRPHGLDRPWRATDEGEDA